MSERVRIILLMTMAIATCSSVVRADNLSDCQALFQAGRYAECREATAKAVELRSYGEEWPILKARSELSLGLYPESLETIAAGIERYTWSVRLRRLQQEAALANGQRELAAEAVRETEKLASTAAWRYTDADDLVALGQIALVLGADPKAVQEGFFERARRNYPNRPDGFIAAADLALKKGDAAFAAELLQPIMKDFAGNPDVLFLYSQAIETADAEQSGKLLQQVLEKNAAYFPALQSLAERQIDREDYAGAEGTLQQILAVNPNHPAAHALRAVIHHLRNDVAAEAESRSAALKYSVNSPEVDYLIGRKLSQKYRFREGAAAQRRALEADANFTESRIQLAQDLLRLGEEAEGWTLAEEARKKDEYNTTLFNLLQLKDSLDRYTTVTSEHFEIRMEKGEAALYGARVTQLLEDAWGQMTERYACTPEVPVYVEIYARADDFAVRTFGMPDVAGFLGVCFGRVITANSPASRRDNPINWESVLWHEFCHVITLQKTGNRIPRWLSEGISVYEERLRDGRWGQRMTPEWRARIAAGKVTPVDRLSSAFLQAESGEDLNFAYYQSSMVVEHIATLHGMPALNAILADLNSGVQINDALGRHAGGLEALQATFTDFLKTRAEQFAPMADFSREQLDRIPADDHAALKLFVSEHPGNIPALMRQASVLVQGGELDAAVVVLKSVGALFPDDDSVNSAGKMLAEVYRKQQNFVAEAEQLREHLRHTADDVEAATRLQELSEQTEAWPDVVTAGQTVFAIDPFRVAVIQRMVTAGERLGDVTTAVEGLKCLLQLQPDDAARLRYRVALQLKEKSPEEARRSVLLSLEQAPRYRDAFRLLKQLPAPVPGGLAEPQADVVPHPESPADPAQ
ncbi:MAG: tetratricopeptide repeat protein [Planctomycetia bacterium]